MPFFILRRIPAALAALGFAATPLIGQSPDPAVPAPGQVLSLPEVIERALAADPAAVGAESALSLARADQLQARGSLLPTINSNLIYANSSNQRFDQSTGQLVSENYATQLQANYEIFGGGRRLLQIRASGADVDAAEAQYRAQRFQTILAATRGYFAAAAADDLLAAARGRLERARAQLEFARTRLEVGTATTSDVLRAELEVGNSELAVLQGETALEARRLELGRLAGVDGAVRPAPGALPTTAPELPDEEALVHQALGRAPSILAADAALSAARSNRLSSWSAFLPSVRLVGGYDWFAFEFPPNRQSWAVRVIASLPLFNGFQRETAIMRVNAQERAAAARSRDAELAVQAQLRTAYRAVSTAERQVEIAGRGVELAREDLRVQEERYQMGVATIVDLQTSQVALADAEAAAVVARQTLGTAVAELEAILGERIER